MGVTTAASLTEDDYEVIEVVNGFTLVVARLNGGMTSAGHDRDRAVVRLIGIEPHSSLALHDNSPRPSAAFVFTKRFVSSRRVRIRLDRRQIDENRTFLAYVYVDKKMLNEQLVRAGLAQVATAPGDSSSVTRHLRLAEQEARRLARGYWADATP